MSGLLCDTVVMTCSHLYEPYEQLLQRLIEHHHTGSVRQCRFGGRDGGRFGWRRMAHNFPLGFGSRLFVLNTMREAKFEDLLAQLIHNLIKNTDTRENTSFSSSTILMSVFTCGQCLEPCED